MASPGGWTGKILRVNLTTGTCSVEDLNMEWAGTFVGGRGLAARYLYEEIDPAIDPFSPDNKIIFATGPLTGTNASCGARYMVITKGAQTNTITTSNSGGHWGPELKFAGYDMVIIEGKAAKPVYLFIYDDLVEIRSAEHLWGKTVFDTEDTIREEVGIPDAHVACIGPAGENLVRFACIMNDKHRAAGRSGVGAVMGSKNLKAIAVRGTGAVTIANPEAYMQAQWAAKAKLKTHPVTGEGLPTFGTMVLTNVVNEHGALPTNNFQLSQLEGAEGISGERLHDTRLVNNKACFACTIACGRVNKLGDGSDRYMVTTHARNWKIATEGPEYEPAWALGADCGVNDLDAVIKANYLCNELGLDPISMGATLAAAMEMYEKGILTDAQTGMPLRFGSGEALVAMTEKTGYREGFGNELAEGSKRMCDKFGHPEFFMGVKGSEFPAYDPRGIQGMGLTYATSNRGACHLKSYTVASEVLGIPMKTDPDVTEGKAALVKLFQDLTGAVDATGLCLFLTFGIGADEIVPELAGAIGADLKVEDAVTVGDAIFNLERAWNERAGFTGKDDTLPDRILKEPVPAGPKAGAVNRLHEMLPEYYQLRGWTADGKVPEEKKQAIGLTK
jgi:aldehyde:ferredoxin oxidoreductase